MCEIPDIEYFLKRAKEEESQAEKALKEHRFRMVCQNIAFGVLSSNFHPHEIFRGVRRIMRGEDCVKGKTEDYWKEPVGFYRGSSWQDICEAAAKQAGCKKHD